MKKVNICFILQLENLISQNYFLNQSAKEAYKAYVRAYDSHHLKTIFDIETLDFSKVCLSFGFKIPPAVDLKMTGNVGDRIPKRKGYNRNADNGMRKTHVYRQKHRNDKRQFGR